MGEFKQQSVLNRGCGCARSEKVNHHLAKRTGQWFCSICGKTWKRLPKSTCPGLPEAEAAPWRLATLIRLKSVNQKPGGPALACDLETKIELYSRFGTEVDNLDLPPNYYNRDSYPKDWISLPDLFKYNLKPEGSAVGCYWDANAGDWVYLYVKSECAIADPNLPQCYSSQDYRVDRSKIPSHLKAEYLIEQNRKVLAEV